VRDTKIVKGVCELYYSISFKRSESHGTNLTHTSLKSLTYLSEEVSKETTS